MKIHFLKLGQLCTQEIKIFIPIPAENSCAKLPHCTVNTQFCTKDVQIYPKYCAKYPR